MFFKKNKASSKRRPTLPKCDHNSEILKTHNHVSVKSWGNTTGNKIISSVTASISKRICKGLPEILFLFVLLVNGNQCLARTWPADAPLKEIFWFLRHLVEGWFATSVWSMLKTKKNFSASGTQTRREINLALEVAKELNEVTSNSSILLK